MFKTFFEWRNDRLLSTGLKEIVICPDCGGEGVVSRECECCGNEKEIECECCGMRSRNLKLMMNLMRSTEHRKTSVPAVSVK